jgi:SAM-dependent methyltransferase
MQTPAEAKLIETLASLCGTSEPTLLNAGAGTSAIIEDALVERGARFREDRVDLVDAALDRPFVRRTFRCSVEQMTPVPAGEYDLAFSNYLLEHVPDLRATAREMHRVLRPGGAYVISVPNPTAPEFLFARFTPLWLHRVLLGRPVGEKYYSYRSLGHLRGIFLAAGFVPEIAWHYSSIEDYVERFAALRVLGRAYDRALAGLGWPVIMGNACLVFRKPAVGSIREIEAAAR